MKFAHLHLHSHYSLLDGMSTIDEILLRASHIKPYMACINDNNENNKKV